MLTGCLIKPKGDKEYYIDGRLHREDGPAIEYANGDKAYYIDGKLHREDGPAIECVSGKKYYYLNDIKVEAKDLPNYELVRLRKENEELKALLAKIKELIP